MSNSNGNNYLKSEALDYDYETQMKTYFGKEEKMKNIIKKFDTNKISTTKYNLFTFYQKVY
jgi:hypothetical protein